MKSGFFVSFCLLLTSGLIYFDAQFRAYFSRPDVYIAEIERLQEKLKSEKFSRQIQRYEFEEFKQYVATLLPNELRDQNQKEQRYQMRSLASVVQKVQSESLLEMKAHSLFEEAKKFFRDKNYKSAIQKLNEINRRHPYFAKMPEVYFFLVESYYQTDEFDEVVTVVNKMVDLYPEFELTGYALLRAAKVFEMQDRHDEAVIFYETVMRTFPQREIASTAEASLRAIEL